MALHDAFVELKDNWEKAAAKSARAERAEGGGGGTAGGDGGTAGADAASPPMSEELRRNLREAQQLIKEAIQSKLLNSMFIGTTLGLAVGIVSRLLA